MKDADVGARLEARKAALEREDAEARADRATVELDQQMVGRLSRMDAMQRQAMAQANARRRAAERQRIDAALARLEEGEYGFCVDCGEAVEPKRLEADPATAKCMSCAHG